MVEQLQYGLFALVLQLPGPSGALIGVLPDLPDEPGKRVFIGIFYGLSALSNLLIDALAQTGNGQTGTHPLLAHGRCNGIATEGNFYD